MQSVGKSHSGRGHRDREKGPFRALSVPVLGRRAFPSTIDALGPVGQHGFHKRGCRVAQNLFTDFPDRVADVEKYSDLKKLALPLEEAFGEKDAYKSADEAMEVYLGTLAEIGKFAATEIRPQAAAIDSEGLPRQGDQILAPERILEIVSKGAQLGIFSGPIDKANGGFNMPRVVLSMALEMLGHACPNTALTIAAFCMGDFFVKWATPEQKEIYLPRFLEGKWQTSMALTEPNAGSDLGKLRSTGVKQGDHWVVNGTKHFITNGNGDLTFAIVRTDPKSEGLRGLSVILIPRHIEGKSGENYRVTKAEHKICLHGSPTCELVFEGSIGYLFGPEGEGFKVMSDLMNSARVAVSAIALGVAGSALEAAKDYARTRVTMGKPIIQHPMIADMLYEMEVEIRAMRALLLEASCAHDWMRIYEKRGDQKNFKRWKKRYRRLTPLVKYMICEKVIPMTRNAVQIYGGYGVCTEYPVERFFRESIIYAIYEGTSQIQSLMVLKDTLKDVAALPGGFLGSLAGAWAEAKVTLDPMKSKLLQARNELNQAIRAILLSIVKGKFRSDIDSLKENRIQEFLKAFSLQLLTPQTDLTYPFLVAERLTRIVCDYYALKCLVDHHVSGDKERERWILEFAELAIPRMRLENHYMVNRLPSTLAFLKQEAATAQAL